MPPNGMVKLTGFICVKTAVPTVTVTGIVVVSPGAVNTNSPVKVPASAPPPGRLAAVTETVAVEGAVPLVGVTDNHAPPSAVVKATVQFSEPVVPPLLIRTICEVAAPPGLREKLNPPGRLSKKGPLATTVKLTGTTIERPGLANSVMMISPE